jgi:hypothetical protein
MTTYTILTTFPALRSSANVGDQLITVAVKELIEREKGPVQFLTVFREDPLDDLLDQINETSAVLMPGFPIRDVPMYPGCYRLTADLDRIRPPLIPIGANWNIYPGDGTSRIGLRYSEATLGFLRRVAAGVEAISCREDTVRDVLRRHGIKNTVMTGDPAWYDPAFFGHPMYRPEFVRTVVFSPPLSAAYREQGLSVLRCLRRIFPTARGICAMHLTDQKNSPFADKSETNDASMRPDIAEKNAAIREEARLLGFEVLELAGDVERLSIYQQCDLHVGYECHAHLSFFRYRRPSVLIAEDARGVGFNYTLGIGAGGMVGFVRRRTDLPHAENRGGTSGYCVSDEDFALAPAREDLDEELEQYLREELDSRFRRFLGISAYLDETYETRMAPFLRALPS